MTFNLGAVSVPSTSKRKIRSGREREGLKEEDEEVDMVERGGGGGVERCDGICVGAKTADASERRRAKAVAEEECTFDERGEREGD